MAFYQLYREQKMNISLDEAWEFISSPKNLQKITPTDMDFKIKSQHLPEKMHSGMIIIYKVKVLPGIRSNWVSEITHVKEKEFFVDEQRIGPYALWHHQHILVPLEKGVLMKDIITYRPPMGFLGAIANRLIIKSKLKAIFDFRRMALEQRFGVYEG